MVSPQKSFEGPPDEGSRHSAFGLIRVTVHADSDYNEAMAPEWCLPNARYTDLVGLSERGVVHG